LEVLPVLTDLDEEQFMAVATLRMDGKEYAVVPLAEYRRLLSRQGNVLDDEGDLPRMPPRRANGDYPAVQAARVSIARDIIRSRRAAGLSQAELARRAGIRVETLNRIERAKVTPDAATVEKIEKALSD
jgi:ribosome-binding protein aMBF1 (putative translation factor)